MCFQMTKKKLANLCTCSFIYSVSQGENTNFFNWKSSWSLIGNETDFMGYLGILILDKDLHQPQQKLYCHRCADIQTKIKFIVYHEYTTQKLYWVTLTEKITCHYNIFPLSYTFYMWLNWLFLFIYMSEFGLTRIGLISY